MLVYISEKYIVAIIMVKEYAKQGLNMKQAARVVALPKHRLISPDYTALSSQKIFLVFTIIILLLYVILIVFI
jgi:hypothetical protein